jgi:hypothetical protein
MIVGIGKCEVFWRSELCSSADRGARGCKRSDRDSGIIVCIIITLEADGVEGRDRVNGPRSEPHDPAARHGQR